MKPIINIAVVGGGTAGWLTACHIAKVKKDNANTAVHIQLIESPDIPTIGVGEGTVPAIRQSLEYLGISEQDLVTQCDATFKQSIKFVDWLDDPVVVGSHFYHHLFDYPITHPVDASTYWIAALNGTQSFADIASVQASICDAGLAPKKMTDRAFEGVASYAYHFDAGKFSLLLRDLAIKTFSVEHKKANVVGVIKSEDGMITHLKTDLLGELAVDFVVDCTGFAATLLAGEMGAKFIERKDVLFADRALVAQAQYSAPDAPIPCSTLATAQANGWIWDIGLPNRRGLGYVYSSLHCDAATAEATFSQYVGDDKLITEARTIRMNIGYRDKFWIKNCASIGLSQGFVEPLEATGLLMFDVTAKMLAHLIPLNPNLLSTAADRFNDRLAVAWEGVVDFIKLHYCLSRRVDSDFWVDNRSEPSIPKSLADKLALWSERKPNDYDFGDAFGIFHKPNYEYVLYGMDCKPSLQGQSVSSDYAREMQNFLSRLPGFSYQLKAQLLPHREYIERIKKYGIPRI